MLILKEELLLNLGIQDRTLQLKTAECVLDFGLEGGEKKSWFQRWKLWTFMMFLRLEVNWIYHLLVRKICREKSLEQTADSYKTLAEVLIGCMSTNVEQMIITLTRPGWGKDPQGWSTLLHISAVCRLPLILRRPLESWLNWIKLKQCIILYSRVLKTGKTS